MPSIMWFRRDLRLLDNPALLSAIAEDGSVLPVFVVDQALWATGGPVRRAYLLASLRSLDASLGGGLCIVHGEPSAELSRLAREIGAATVHIAADYGVYGVHRDDRVDAALAAVGVELVRTGSPYAVAPGRVTKDDATAYRVYTPFYKAWCRHGWRTPAEAALAPSTWLHPSALSNTSFPDLSVGDEAVIAEVRMQPAGEDAAWARWMHFRDTALTGYGNDRNRADLDGTSMLSAHLRWGEIHPRSLLAELDDSPGPEVFRKEIAWREFYADVLHQAPRSSTISLDERFEAMPWTDDDADFTAWVTGRTGYPFVDAGMRQLRAEGWMHNRVRMVVASFLIKDLHQRWQRGAAEFMRWLADGDLASNTHGWQWTAGCGTDASPFYRVFNPVMQGLKFDPNGDYVRRYIPELAHIDGAKVHEPWDVLDGYAHGYPERIVDHKAEREVALADYSAIKLPANGKE